LGQQFHLQILILWFSEKAEEEFSGEENFFTGPGIKTSENSIGMPGSPSVSQTQGEP